MKTSDPSSTPLIGLVPASYISPCPSLRQTTALYEYVPVRDESTGELDNEEEMEIGEGEPLEVLEEEGDWVLCRKIDGSKAVGFVPANYLEVSRSIFLLVPLLLRSNELTRNASQGAEGVNGAEETVEPEAQYDQASSSSQIRRFSYRLMANLKLSGGENRSKMKNNIQLLPLLLLLPTLVLLNEVPVQLLSQAIYKLGVLR